MKEIDHSLLLREFLDWIAARPRSYDDTVEAWRSSCPRHPVLDDAFTARLITSVGKSVVLTPQGEALLAVPMVSEPLRVSDTAV